MALRIPREEYYLPLPMNGEHVRSMVGVKDYFVPVTETCIPDWVLNELRGMGNRSVANGLVVEYNGIDKPDENEDDGIYHVAFSVHCVLTTKNGVPNVHLLHITPVKFGLCWVKGKFYQHGEKRKST